MGDPIEWAAASAALTAEGASPGQVALGAVKANIGHLDAAAGLAALIKALLVVRGGVIPPVAGFARYNPMLEVDGSPLRVPIEAREWTAGRPRRAGVSAFGIGGTNVHAIVEQAPAPQRVRRPVRRVGRVLLLSATDTAALGRSSAELADFLADGSPDMGEVAVTLASGRTPLADRLALTGRSAAEARERLRTGTGVVRGTRPGTGPAPVVFLFPGQSTQYAGMALPLAETLPGFTDRLDACLAEFEPELAARAHRALLDDTTPAAELAETELAQPALFAMQYAAGTALGEMGVAPVAVAGHSLGEATAACFAGMMSLRAAARFVRTRGRAMQQCPPGAMLALRCDGERARDLIGRSGRRLALAATNSANASTVSGTTDEVDAFVRWLADAVPWRRLSANRAFHSALVEPAVSQLARVLAATDLCPPMMPVALNATGELLARGAAVDADLLAR
ncbi:acyltransferase domain-containing protein, partial [Micromonospora sp. DH15]|nr:acyltransferase domain-containing protein [Micromonospora sp. DH15]